MPRTISREARQLRDAILAEARARGFDLDEEGLALEQDLPVLRLRLGGRVLHGTRISLPGTPGSSAYAPDVITVHGAGFRSSRMWPRKRDGGFRIDAIVDHMLALVREELEAPRPDLQFAVGVPARASGLHVLHAAAQVLGTLKPDVTPEMIVQRVKDQKVRARIETHVARDGLTDGDLRALGEAAGMFVGRALKMEHPFTPISTDIMTMLRFGRRRDDQVERRVVLLLDRRRNKITLADPTGEAIVEMNLKVAEDALALGATQGRPWVGTASRWSRRDE